MPGTFSGKSMTSDLATAAASKGVLRRDFEGSVFVS